MTEETLFERARQLPAAERAAFLDRECAEQPERRIRIEALLAADAVAHSPLDHPLAPLGDQTVTHGGDQAPTASYVPNERTNPVIVGKYTLVEVIGEGGMGSVWRAKQTEPVKRFVAVKLIKAGMDSKQVLARFEAERQALALMDHPNIAKVLDGGLHEGRPFFVMELVKGVPITDYCDHHKLTPPARLELFVQACQAIQHAHQKGIIHRDIKPSNVLVALYDDMPVVKVIDFGVAKATGGTLTEKTLDTGFGGVVGTPQYMSPEQATFNNLDIDTRSDVYALGVLLYELLTGSPPFSKQELERKGLLEILRVVREDEPPRPSTKLSTAEALPSLSANRGTEPKKLTGLLRHELDWIVMKALEKNRTRRYETANAFAADVQRYLAGEAVLAHPPSTAYRIKKFVQKHRRQVLGATVFLMLLVVAVIVSSWLAVKARDAEKVADEKRREAEASAKAEKAASDLANEFLGQVMVAKSEAELNAARLQVDRDLLESQNNPQLGLLRLVKLLKAEPARIDFKGPGGHPGKDVVTPQGRGELDEFITAAVLTLGQEFTTLLPPITHDHGGRIVWYEVSPDGCTLFTNGEDNLVCLWDARTARRLATLREGEEKILHSGYSPDGQLVFTADRAGVVRVWEATTGKLRAKTEPRPQRYDLPDSLKVGPNPFLDNDAPIHATKISGNRLLTKRVVLRAEGAENKIAWEGPVELWDTTNGRRIVQLDQPGYSAEHFEFVSDTKWITTTEGDSTVLVFAPEDGQLVARLRHPAAEPVFKYVASPNGKYIATLARPTGKNPTLRIWDTAAWALVATHENLQYGTFLRFWSDELLGVGTLDFGFSEWSVFEPKRPALLYTMSDDDASGLRVSGDYMMTSQNTILDVKTGRRLPVPRGRRYHPALAQFASDGRFAPCLHPQAGVFGPEIGHGLIDTRTEKSFRVRKEGPELGHGIRLEGRFVGDGTKFLGGVGFVDGGLRVWLLPTGMLKDIPADRLELWAQVAVCGELDDDGTFKKWNEATWERKRQELAGFKPLGAEIPFPGHLATDKLHWLRTAFDEADNAAKDRLAIGIIGRANTVGDRTEAIRYGDWVYERSGKLLSEHNWIAAEALLREFLALREKTEPDAWSTFNTRSLLGAALLGQKKYAAAEPLLVKGYEGMKAREKAIPSSTRIPEALDRLIELYTVTKRPGELKKYQELRATYPTPKEPAAKPLEKK